MFRTYLIDLKKNRFHPCNFGVILFLHVNKGYSYFKNTNDVDMYLIHKQNL